MLLISGMLRGSMLLWPDTTIWNYMQYGYRSSYSKILFSGLECCVYYRAVNDLHMISRRKDRNKSSVRVKFRNLCSPEGYSISSLKSSFTTPNAIYAIYNLLICIITNYQLNNKYLSAVEKYWKSSSLNTMIQTKKFQCRQ